MLPTAIRALLSILENPFDEKGYVDLKEHYKLVGMFDEANSLDYLIRKKFHAESPPINKEQ
jgi:hypothetical protein